MRLMDGGSGGGVTAYDKKYSTTPTPKPYQATADNGRSAYLRKIATTAKPKPKPKTTTKKTTSTYKTPTVASSRVVSSRYVTPTPTTPAAPVTPFTPTTTTPAVSPGYAGLTTNYLNQLTGSVNKIYDQQKASQLAQIKADQTASVAKLNQQKTDTAASYQGQRNQADVVSAQNVQKLRELMAANGLNASGENVTAQISANSDRQNSINSLNLQQQSAVRDINNQINDVNNPAKQQAVVASIEAERAKALLDAKNTAEEKAWREYTYNNMSANEKSTLEWAKQQYGEDAAWKMFELNYNGELAKSQSQAELSAYTGFNNNTGGGGTAASGPKTFQSHLQQAVAKGGVPASWASSLSQLVKLESGYKYYAKNPNSSAYGYGQFLTGTRNEYEKKTGLDYSDPVNQLIMMSQYVKDRYGTPENALKFWYSHDPHWY